MLGTAAMFAAGMLWVKNVVKLNNKITGLICFAHSGSVQVYSLVTGLVIEEHPAWFLYIMSGTAVCITASFTMMSLIAKMKHCMSGHTDKV